VAPSIFEWSTRGEGAGSTPSASPGTLSRRGMSIAVRRSGVHDAGRGRAAISRRTEAFIVCEPASSGRAP
jgi:hypothetical protein